MSPTTVLVAGDLLLPRGGLSALRAGRDPNHLRPRHTRFPRTSFRMDAGCRDRALVYAAVGWRFRWHSSSRGSKIFDVPTKAATWGGDLRARGLGPSWVKH
ncbi:unnamed protein product, partial [Laminaria digitata]